MERLHTSIIPAFPNEVIKDLGSLLYNSCAVIKNIAWFQLHVHPVFWTDLSLALVYMFLSTESFGVTLGKAGLLEPEFLCNCFLLNLQIQEPVPSPNTNPQNSTAHHITLLQAGQSMWSNLLSFFNFSSAWAEQVGVQWCVSLWDYWSRISFT